MKNLYASIPSPLPEERFTTILKTKSLLLERIVSRGQATPPGKWLCQEREEWVILLQGAARVRFRKEKKTRTLRPGDHIYIPAQSPHRVTWTDPRKTTVWLALHFRP